jgi:hypothetical protein
MVRWPRSKSSRVFWSMWCGVPAFVPLKLERVPPPRFLINQRVDQLCSLLMRETERQAPLAPLYFEGLATALVIAVVSQTDVRLPAAGNLTDSPGGRLRDSSRPSG